MKTLRKYLEEKEGLVNNPSEVDLINKICWKLWNNKNKKFIKLLIELSRKDEELKEELKRLFKVSHFEFNNEKDIDYISQNVADRSSTNDSEIES